MKNPIKTNDMPEVKIPYVCERDIDFLLLGELSSSPDFISWFAERVGISAPVQLLSAGCSITTQTGESDLELFVKKGSEVHGILINSVGSEIPS
ncbi:MAG: hypothetical protein WBC70_14475 [Candidatus Aminicenantales bacterium]